MLNDIKVVNHYYGTNRYYQSAVPSAISYAEQPGGEEGWGSDIAEDCLAFINTKFELEDQNRQDELELTLKVLEGIQSLDWTHIKGAGCCPQYTWKTPVHIISDYLAHIYRSIDRFISSPDMFFSAPFFHEVKVPVDLVVTVPAVRMWSLNGGLCAC